MEQERDSAMLSMDDRLYRCTPEYELPDRLELLAQHPSRLDLVNQEHGAAHAFPNASVHTQTPGGHLNSPSVAQTPINAALGLLLLPSADILQLFDDQQGHFTYTQPLPEGSDLFLQHLFQYASPIGAELILMPDGLHLALKFFCSLWRPAPSEAAQSAWGTGVEDVLAPSNLSQVQIPSEGLGDQRNPATVGPTAFAGDVLIDSPTVLSGIAGAGVVSGEPRLSPEIATGNAPEPYAVAGRNDERGDVAAPGDETFSIGDLLQQKLDEGTCWCGHQLKRDERPDNARRHWRDSCPDLPSVEVLLTLVRMYQPHSITSTIRSLVKRGQDLYGDDAVLAEAMRHRKLIKRFESLNFGTAETASLLLDRAEQLKSQWSDHLMRDAEQPQDNFRKRQQKTVRPGAPHRLSATGQTPPRSQQSHLPQNYPYPVAMPQASSSSAETDPPWGIQPSFRDISNQFGQESRYVDDPFEGLLTESTEEFTARILAVASSPPGGRRTKRRKHV